MKKFNAALQGKAEAPPIFDKVEKIGEMLADAALGDEMTVEVRLDIFKALMTFAGVSIKILPTSDPKGAAFNGIVEKIKSGSNFGNRPGAGQQREDDE